METLARECETEELCAGEEIARIASQQALNWYFGEAETQLIYHANKVFAKIDRKMKIMWRRRRRCGGRGRFPKPVTLGAIPYVSKFTPFPPKSLKPVFMEMAELEALRLVDLEGLSQEKAGQKMSISRGTVWRLVQSARKKTAQALTEGRPLQIVVSQSIDEK